MGGLVGGELKGGGWLLLVDGGSDGLWLLVVIVWRIVLHVGHRHAVCLACRFTLAAGCLSSCLTIIRYDILSPTLVIIRWIGPNARHPPPIYLPRRLTLLLSLLTTLMIPREDLDAVQRTLHPTVIIVRRILLHPRISPPIHNAKPSPPPPLNIPIPIMTTFRNQRATGSHEEPLFATLTCEFLSVEVVGGLEGWGGAGFVEGAGDEGF